MHLIVVLLVEAALKENPTGRQSLIRRDRWELMQLPLMQRVLATAEILLRSIRMGYRVKEYPTVVHDRKFGRSKLNTLKTIGGHIRVLYSLWRKRDFHAVTRPSMPKTEDEVESEPVLT